jgi:hypothetical protein
VTTSYPGAVDNLTNPTPSDTLNSATVPHAAQHANANDAIEAVQTTLGVNPQGSAGTVKARLDQLEVVIDDRLPGETGSNAPTGTPPNGYVWVDTTTNAIKVWNGTTWVDPSNAGGGGTAWAVASGGTESTVTEGGKTYKLHAFTANGTLTVTTPGLVEILLVSGGSAQWDAIGAGGGGGDIRDGLKMLPAGALAVTVGQGGARSATWPTTHGTKSSIGTAATTANGVPNSGATAGTGLAGDTYTNTITGASQSYAGSAATPSSTLYGEGANAAGRAGVVYVRYET